MADYVCGKCKTEYPGAKSTPACTVTTQCKNGVFVRVVEKKEAEVVLTPPTCYSLDTSKTVYKGYTGSGSHKPKSSVWIHTGGLYAISIDGSTHSSGRAAWKGFLSTSTGWRYLGSYDVNLAKVDRGAGTGDVPQLPTT
ncbi:MAG: hypothetical protein ACRC33_23455 [Gemmataceae bacterium]